ncbi:MAG: ribokinase [Candidatus Puniceispirillaceae bacterium]
MTIFNLGSINLDYFYQVPHLPQAGETLATTRYHSGLGGKGANQSVAIARGGGKVVHIGNIHHGDTHHLALLEQAGVDLRHVEKSDIPTGHAIVIVEDDTAENQILLMQGANIAVTKQMIEAALQEAGPHDWALTQNETNLGEHFLHAAKHKGLQICYSAAPFVKQTVLSLLPIVDLLVVNEGEAHDISEAVAKAPDEWGIPHVIITKGADGAYYYGKDGAHYVPSHKVEAIDTTGAGDTYLGFLLAGLSKGQSMKEAMQIAASAAAIQVTRSGTASAIPSIDEIAHLDGAGDKAGK